MRIRVNFFEIFLDLKNPTKHHYDIAIEPEKPKYFFPAIIEKFMLTNFPGRLYAYDNAKNVYTSRPLGDGLHQPFTANVTIMDTDRQSERTYSVTIKHVNVIDMSVLQAQKLQTESLESNLISTARQCLEIIFKANSARIGWIQGGRGFFDPTREHPIGKGKVIKRGFTHSVILGSKPFLNLDMLYKIFPRSGDILKEIVQEVCGPTPRPYDRNPPPPIDLNRGLSEYQRNDLEDFLKGIKIEVVVPGRPESERRKYRVNGLEKCARDNVFEHEGKRTTVQQYYLEEKGYKILYPNLPTVWAGPSNKKYCFPIEVCKIAPNQAKRFRATDSDTRAIGTQATCDTVQRKQNIMDNANKIGLKQNTFLQEFGVDVDKEFKQVDSRILIHPKLGYRGKEVEVRKGQWEPDVFRQSEPLSNWCILVLDRVNRDVVFKFRDNLIATGTELGMSIQRIPDSQVIVKSGGRVEERDLVAEFDNLKQKYKVQLVFVVIPDFKDVYSKVKRAGEIGSGVLTSCIKGRNLQRPNMTSILKNVLIKINTKLNNLNHILLPVPQLKAKNQWCIEGRTMVLGADVTHPAPQDKKVIPSVAAVVANHDREVSLYNMEWSFQDPSIKDHEIIQDLNEMVAKQLKFYVDRTGGKPERLLFFRDGVSDGQIDEVRYREIKAIKEACKQVLGSYIPLTFVIVQKRHRTRFFPDPRDRNVYDKNKNVPAGTVVDKEIVRSDMFEFYLVSHASILGTARPTKYKTILDECNISADELEHLTYYLCHMYNRCSRTVSYPTPTYYAHLACFRIRNYLLTERNIDMANLRRAKQRLQGEASFYLNNPLYFI